MEEELTRYLNYLLMKQNPSRRAFITQVTQHIPSLVTEENNASPMQPINMQEVEESVNQMVEGKAPSLDGFTINFFQH